MALPLRLNSKSTIVRRLWCFTSANAIPHLLFYLLYASIYNDKANITATDIVEIFFISLTVNPVPCIIIYTLSYSLKNRPYQVCFKIFIMLILFHPVPFHSTTEYTYLGESAFSHPYPKRSFSKSSHLLSVK